MEYRDNGVPLLAVVAVSFDLAAGEILGLLGPSGCGKSTLLRAIAGLEPLASGTITFDGRDLARVPVHARRFGLLFQDGQLFPHRDVGRNVSYGLEVTGVPRAHRADRVAQLLASVGLAGMERREVATLSGGQRQRVALARALAPHPRLMLLDEPFSALDHSLREHLAGEVREVLRAANTPALFVTHDHNEAFAMADRVAVLAWVADREPVGGRILQIAPPEELWRAPASWAVAEILGYQAWVETAAGRIAVGPRGLVAHLDGTDPGQTPSWPAVVRDCVFTTTGPRFVVEADLGAGARRFSARGTQALAPGSRVTVTLDLPGCAPLPSDSCAVTQRAE